MDSTFYMNEHVVEHAVVSRLLSYLSCDTIGFKNRIKLASDILTDCARNKGEQWCCYKPVQWNIKGWFDIFNDFSDHVTLIQLIDTSGSINHAVIITISWIYDSNYKRVLPLII